jgi:putative flippase GtrA
VDKGSNTQRVGGWVKGQILSNTRVIKYGLVGFTGVAVNLMTMAAMLTFTSQKGWVAPTVANVVSTVTNFFLHNLWTFSDRQHQGARLVRGFVSFVITSILSIGVTTVAYMGFTRVALYVAAMRSGQTVHQVGLFVALGCQFVAILLGASVSYTLNREFTWAAPKECAMADVAQNPDSGAVKHTVTENAEWVEKAPLS